MNHSEQMEALRRECGPCQRCALADTRTNLVFGDGNPDSGIMLIGEGPGEQEDLMGVPFVGRGGQLLNQMLDIIGLDRSKYYICNIVKCRPPRNRDPLNTEQEVCIGMTAIYHPAALLRDEMKRPETFDDLKSIQSKIQELWPGFYTRA